MEYLLGIDIGTTGTKSILFSLEGRMIASAYKGYPLYSEKGNVVEQDALDWWDAVVCTVKECISVTGREEKVIALSLSTQGGTLVPVDDRGKPLRRSISWMDTRSRDEGRKLEQRKPADYFYYASGWPMENNCASMILWLKKNEADLCRRTKRFLTTLDYINYKLCGRYVTDFTNAAMSGMINLQKKSWDSFVYEDLGLTEAQLPELKPTGCILGTLLPSAAVELGLDADVLVVNGAHDQYCGAVGAGALNIGDTMLSTGTSWAVLGVADFLIYDTKNYFAPGFHIPDNKYGLMATLPTGGVSMEWFKNNFCSIHKQDRVIEESFSKIDEMAAKKSAGAEGVFFYPYFHGSCLPERCSDVRASFLGIGLNHDRYTLARSVMEGVAFSIRWILDSLEQINNSVQKIHMVGGATKSSFWTQIVSDITGKPVIKMKTANAPCIGAAAIAGIGAGIYKNYEQAFRCMVNEDVTILPSSRKEEYEQIFQKYKTGFQNIKEYYINTK